MPFREGLAFTYDILLGFDIKKHISLFCAGKILTGFHVFKAIALGADACYSARGMMLAMGCIQSLLCNTNKCPTGVATQDPELIAGLVVEDKKFRVRCLLRQHFWLHKATVGGACQTLAPNDSCSSPQALMALARKR